MTSTLAPTRPLALTRPLAPILALAPYQEADAPESKGTREVLSSSLLRTLTLPLTKKTFLP